MKRTVRKYSVKSRNFCDSLADSRAEPEVRGLDSCLRPPSRQSELGVSIIEFSIALPIALIFIISVIFFATYVNARSGLSSSVQNAVRLAKTRSSVIGAGGLPLLNDLNGWLSAPTISLQSPLLASSSSFPVIDFNAFTAAQGGMTPLSSASLECLYASAYVYQAMKKIVGNSLKYPCSVSAGVVNGDGCVSCWPVDDYPIASSGDGQCDGIQCLYRPSNVFIDPIEGLMGLLTSKPDYQFEISPKAAHFFN